MKKIKAIDSLRASKIQNPPFNSEIPNVEEDVDNYNIIHFGLFVNFIKQFLCSPGCGSKNVTIIDDLTRQIGFSHKLVISCDDCPYSEVMFTSQLCNKSKKIPGRQPFKINIRTVTAFREIGKGYKGIQNVARCMNMFSISNTSFRSLNEQLQVAYENAAKISMKNAVNETKLTDIQTEAKLPDHLHSCRVAVDSTWQKKETLIIKWCCFSYQQS